MTEYELRARVCAQARLWLGRREADGSHREIIDRYNQIVPLPRGYRLQYNDPWCAGFVSALAQALGLTDWIFPECGCGPMVERYQKAGRWMENDAYVPQPGDVIFYDWQDSGMGDNRGEPDHVGLVLTAEGDRITVIEGNCGNAVAIRTLLRDGRYIRGYGLPDYAAAANSESEKESGSAPIVPADADDDRKEARRECRVTLPVLQLGDRSEAVRAAQYLLKGRGFDLGWMGADGDFGPKTEAAARRFQRSCGIEADGVVGPVTWAELIKFT